MDDFRVNLSLCALAVCLACVGWRAVCVFSGRKQSAVATLSEALVGGFLLFAAGGNCFAATSFPLPQVSGLIILCVVISSLAVRFGFHAPGRRGWNVAVAHALLVGAAAGNFHSSTRLDSWDFEDARMPTKVPVDDAVVVTDHGRIFPVFRYEADQVFDDQVQRVYKKRIIRVASEDLRSNCHGWVFANGRFGVPADAVAALLQDNGYDAVATPLRGDVVVYRDDAGSIVHSGRVRSVHEDGQVWIESKWGSAGRYLHRPEDQCYSTVFTYYRSARPVHEAQIVQTSMSKDARLARSNGLPLRRARG